MFAPFCHSKFLPNKNRAMPLRYRIRHYPVSLNQTHARPIPRYRYAVWVFYCKNLGYTTGTTVLYQLCARIHKPLHEIHQQPPLPGATLRVCMPAQKLMRTYKPAGCKLGLPTCGRFRAVRPSGVRGAFPCKLSACPCWRCLL